MNYKEYLERIKYSLKNYLKGLVILSLLNFVILAIGLKLIGINLWFLKAFAISIIDFLPVLGSGMIMIPWAIIRAITGSLTTGMYLAILYIILTLVRFVAEPIIIGKNVGLPPLMTILIALISVLIFGPIGTILAGFFTVIIKVLWDFYSESKTMHRNDSNF